MFGLKGCDNLRAALSRPSPHPSAGHAAHHPSTHHHATTHHPSPTAAFSLFGRLGDLVPVVVPDVSSNLVRDIVGFVMDGDGAIRSQKKSQSGPIDGGAGDPGRQLLVATRLLDGVD